MSEAEEKGSKRIICLHCGTAAHSYADDRGGLKCRKCGPSAIIDYARDAVVLSFPAPLDTEKTG